MTGNNGLNGNYNHSLNKKCEYCGCPLRRIGSERKNGIPINNNTGKDWGTRKLHKSCFKRKNEEELYNAIRIENKKSKFTFD